MEDDEQQPAALHEQEELEGDPEGLYGEDAAEFGAEEE
jgi:hypothetical protein